jgi:hypothetical protein
MTGKHTDPASAEQVKEALARADGLLRNARYYLSTLRIGADVRPEVWGTVQSARVNVEETLRLLGLSQD